MTSKGLVTYLKDHLAGSQAALEVLDHLESVHRDPAVQGLVPRLRREFLGEREQLVQLLARMDKSEGLPRRIAGWFSEKALEMKLRVDDPSGGPLHLLEAIEMLALGVHGKVGLWRALEQSTSQVQQLASLPLPQLITQGEEQRALIETVRLGAALAAFAPTD